MRRVALPPAGALKGCDQTGCIEIAQPRDRARLLVDRVDPIDPALLAAGAKVEPFLPVVGDPLGVFDHVAIHVGDPERTVGPGLEHRRPEPVVAGCKELAARFVRPARPRKLTPSGTRTIR